MTPDLVNVPKHMLRLGLGALRHANWHANYSSQDNECWSELSVLQAAHACEILIKARIAQEHPLLIFEQLPKALSDAQPLDLQQLIEGGRTFQFAELPNRLWATTGVRIADANCYREFGRLRNCIQHFAVPESVDTSQEALAFIYGVIDPLINECWGLYAIDYNEDHEPHVYLVEGLIKRQIRFLVSTGAAKSTDFADLQWPEVDASGYRREMQMRFARAMRKPRST